MYRFVIIAKKLQLAMKTSGAMVKYNMDTTEDTGAIVVVVSLSSSFCCS